MSGYYNRRSSRLKGYDYAAAGAYFVTLVTQDRLCLFGDIVDGDMQLNVAGSMVFQEWNDIGTRSSSIEIDSFVVMPNHIHGIIVISDPIGSAPSDRSISHVGAPLVGALAPGVPSIAGSRATTRVAPTLGDIVGAFKSLTTVGYVHGVKAFGWPKFPGRLWQRNYYEHVIRKEDSMCRIRRYIRENPARWALDHENPANRRM